MMPHIVCRRRGAAPAARGCPHSHDNTPVHTAAARARPACANARTAKRQRDDTPSDCRRAGGADDSIGGTGLGPLVTKRPWSILPRPGGVTILNSIALTPPGTKTGDQGQLRRVDPEDVQRQEPGADPGDGLWCCSKYRLSSNMMALITSQTRAMGYGAAARRQRAPRMNLVALPPPLPPPAATTARPPPRRRRRRCCGLLANCGALSTMTCAAATGGQACPANVHAANIDYPQT